MPRSRRINTGVPLSPIAIPHETPRRGEPLDERHVHPLPQRAQLAESLPLLKRQYYDVALSTYRQVQRNALGLFPRLR